ncbi:MAG TPA: DUF4168 domain-containing protein [Salinisphaeraceae bacterium]|nr:DUF4168 domain-containing protein [Salinisphaeraceae bacterium]
MSYFARISGIAVLGVAALAAAPIFAQAQGQAQSGAQQQGQMAPQAQPQAEDFSSDQLQSFADASVKVADIRESAEASMAQASDEEEMTQVRQQAQQDMLAAIDDAGLELEEYNQIARTAQTDPELAQKIQSMQ